MPDTILILDDKGVDRALTRIAHEIVEKNGGTDGLVILGIPTRGAYLAERIAEKINSMEGSSVPMGTIDATLYRDDISTKQAKPLMETDIPIDIDGKKVVMVDDVLFTGRTIRAAMNALMDFGRPTVIELAVLIDRGHRELPIKADFVGKNIPTKKTEKINVHLKEVDDKDEVVRDPSRAND